MISGNLYDVELWLPGREGATGLDRRRNVEARTNLGGKFIIYGLERTVTGGVTVGRYRRFHQKPLAQVRGTFVRQSADIQTTRLFDSRSPVKETEFYGLQRAVDNV